MVKCKILITYWKIMVDNVNLQCHRGTYQNRIGHTHDCEQCILDYYEKEIVS